jgi:hypothetical protein
MRDDDGGPIVAQDVESGGGPLGEMFTAVSISTVRRGKYLHAPKTRTIKAGEQVMVLEQAQHEGRLLGRISATEWATIETAAGKTLLTQGASTYNPAAATATAPQPMKMKQSRKKASGQRREPPPSNICLSYICCCFCGGCCCICGCLGLWEEHQAVNAKAKGNYDKAWARSASAAQWRKVGAVTTIALMVLRVILALLSLDPVGSLTSLTADDSCDWALDGICDAGTDGTTDGACDAGTDATDCGQ